MPYYWLAWIWNAKTSYKLMMWSHRHWDSQRKAKKQTDLELETVNSQNWSIDWKTPKCELFDESGKRTVPWEQPVTSQVTICLPSWHTGLNLKLLLAADQREAGCSSSLSAHAAPLCVCSVHLEGATTRSTSVVIPLLALASIIGSQHSYLVIAKSNVFFVFELCWLTKKGC